MMNRYLIMAIETLLQNENGENIAIVDVLFSSIRKAIRTEILAMAFKLFAGLILATMSIYCFFQLAEIFKSSMSHYQNGSLLEVLCFAFIASMSSLALYFLFNKRNKRKKEDEQYFAITIILQKLMIEFTEGIITSFVIPSQTNQEITKENQIL